MTIQIPTAAHLRVVAKQGYADYCKTVLEGPLFKRVLRKIDEAAQIGGTSWEYQMQSDDEQRELKVIAQKLEEVGGLACIFKIGYFAVSWEE
ncbi:hypothetical protein [Lysinibacillus piscis]|uniref:Uncharacterized protein n=1 Tax=Lysinibacillus piscis TaxID=2518931 RepID=A0ABQ5NIY5_9BACI|nr:hypothetical protein [Lysinibacillus sp. KH24]GLC88238.1 hypothetical protein LYSBPC_13650 [Lysinibacillus sp. KH24]